MSSQRSSKCFSELLRSGVIKYWNYHLDKRGKLNVHKTFRGRLTCLLNVFCMFDLRFVSRGDIPCNTSALKPENDWINVKKQRQA